MRKRRSNAQQFDRSHAPRGNDHKTRNTRRGTQRAPRFLCIQHGRASGRAELQLDFPGLRPAGGITYVAGLMCNPCARLLPIPPSFARRRESSVASEPDLDPRLRGDDGSKVDCGHDEGGLCVVAADVSAAGRAKQAFPRGAWERSQSCALNPHHNRYRRNHRRSRRHNPNRSQCGRHNSHHPASACSRGRSESHRGY